MLVKDHGFPFLCLQFVYWKLETKIVPNNIAAIGRAYERESAGTLLRDSTSTEGPETEEIF